MSVTKFKKLSAVQKIKRLVTLYGIPVDIPSKCPEVKAYAAEHGLNNLVEVMVDVRNALIHGTPHKVEKVFNRTNGETERSDLWFQIGGILEQVVLAVAGYEGEVVCRDSDARYRSGATREVPWK